MSWRPKDWPKSGSSTFEGGATRMLQDLKPLHELCKLVLRDINLCPYDLPGLDRVALGRAVDGLEDVLRE